MRKILFSITSIVVFLMFIGILLLSKTNAATCPTVVNISNGVSEIPWQCIGSTVLQSTGDSGISFFIRSVVVDADTVRVGLSLIGASKPAVTLNIDKPLVVRSSDEKVLLTITYLGMGEFGYRFDTQISENNIIRFLQSPTTSFYSVLNAGTTVETMNTRVALDTCAVATKFRVYMTNATLAAGSMEVDQINHDIALAQLSVNGIPVSAQSTITRTINRATSPVDGILSKREYYYDFVTPITLQNNDLISFHLTASSNTFGNTYQFAFQASQLAGVQKCDGSYIYAPSNLMGSIFGSVTTIAPTSSGSVTVSHIVDGFSSTTPILRGSTQNKLMQVVVRAGEHSDIKIDTLDFDFEQIGNENSEYFSNLYLSVGGIQYGNIQDLEGVTTGTSYVTFTDLSINVQKGEQVIITLYGNAEISVSPGTTVNITMDAGDSYVEDQEGNHLVFDDVNSVSDIVFVEPKLIVNIDENTEKTNLVAVNIVNSVVLGTWQFQAENANVSLTDLYFANNSTTGSNTAETGTDFLVNRFQLVVNGSVIAESVPFAGKVHFDLGSVNGIEVAKDGISRVILRAILNNIDNVDSTGLGLKMALYAVEADSYDGKIESIGGVVTTDTIVSLDSAPTANAQYLVKTIPILATNSTGLSTFLTNGTKDFYKFTVTAGPTGDVSWKKIVLDVSGMCTGGFIVDCLGPTSSMYIKDGVDTKSASFGTVASIGKVIIVLDSVETIAAGTAKTYIVGGILTGFSGDHDSLSVRVKDSQVAPFVSPVEYDNVLSDTFVWSDNSGEYESLTDPHWFNGYKIEGLDTVVFQMI